MIKTLEHIYLQASEIGTFLIRFSDSELGGVTVAWIAGKTTILLKLLALAFLKCLFKEFPLPVIVG
jgi:hypothetical protein